MPACSAATGITTRELCFWDAQSECGLHVYTIVPRLPTDILGALSRNVSPHRFHAAKTLYSAELSMHMSRAGHIKVFISGVSANSYARDAPSLAVEQSSLFSSTRNTAYTQAVYLRIDSKPPPQFVPSFPGQNLEIKAFNGSRRELLLCCKCCPE